MESSRRTSRREGKRSQPGVRGWRDGEKSGAFATFLFARSPWPGSDFAYLCPGPGLCERSLGSGGKSCAPTGHAPYFSLLPARCPGPTQRMRGARVQLASLARFWTSADRRRLSDCWMAW
eukprot:1940095-Rhodomonas_salina.1